MIHRIDIGGDLVTDAGSPVVDHTRTASPATSITGGHCLVCQINLNQSHHAVLFSAASVVQLKQLSDLSAISALALAASVKGRLWPVL